MPNTGFANLVNFAAVLGRAQAAILLLNQNGLPTIEASYYDSAPPISEAAGIYAAIQHQYAATPESIFVLQNHSALQKQGYPFAQIFAIASDHEKAGGFLCLMYEQVQHFTSQHQYELSFIIKQFSFELRHHYQQVEQSLQASQHINREQVRDIFIRATDAVIITDSQGNILQWNPRAEQILGWQANEVTGRSFEDLCIPAKSNDAYRQYQENSHTGNQLIELIALHKNKNELLVKLGLSCIYYGKQEYSIIFISDVTEHTEITNRLDKQKAFYEQILNKIPTDIAVFDADHRYLFVNPGAISNPEYRRAIIGKDDYEYAAYRGRETTVPDKRRSQFLEVKKTGQEIRWEDGIRAPDGKMITHLRRMFPVHDEAGDLQFVIGYGMDITDRIEMEEKQSILVKQLSAQNAQLVDFCNIVSHNLRGPLVNMSMLVQFIKESDNTEEQQFLISKLQPVIDNLHITFNELVESIQIKQDVGVPSERINLDDCVQRTLAGLEMEIKKAGAVIETDFSDAGVLYYPSKYLFSIFHNLISNSIKYSSPKRPPRIVISTRRTGDGVLLSVADNGLGLDIEKHKDNLFKIGKVFHRNPNAKGFGLFMTKTQVEAMDGRIWAESTPDAGTTFFVEFTKQS